MSLISDVISTVSKLVLNNRWAELASYLSLIQALLAANPTDNVSDFIEVKAGIAKLQDLLTITQETIMATKAEVAADIAEIKQLVTDTRGVATSAVELITRLLTLITDAAASATDLDAFRSDLALIKTETLAEKDQLAAAVASGPVP